MEDFILLHQLIVWQNLNEEKKDTTAHFSDSVNFNPARGSLLQDSDFQVDLYSYLPS